MKMRLIHVTWNNGSYFFVDLHAKHMLILFQWLVFRKCCHRHQVRVSGAVASSCRPTFLIVPTDTWRTRFFYGRCDFYALAFPGPNHGTDIPAVELPARRHPVHATSRAIPLQRLLLVAARRARLDARRRPVQAAHTPHACHGPSQVGSLFLLLE